MGHHEATACCKQFHPLRTAIYRSPAVLIAWNVLTLHIHRRRYGRTATPRDKQARTTGLGPSWCSALDTDHLHLNTPSGSTLDGQFPPPRCYCYSLICTNKPRPFIKPLQDRVFRHVEIVYSIPPHSLFMAGFSGLGPREVEEAALSVALAVRVDMAPIGLATVPVR